jgi:hypothetical protein
MNNFYRRINITYYTTPSEFKREASLTLQELEAIATFKKELEHLEEQVQAYE